MKTIGQPIGGAVKKKHDGWKEGAGTHFFGITLDGFLVGFYAGLGAAVDVDLVEGDLAGLHEVKGGGFSVADAGAARTKPGCAAGCRITWAHDVLGRLQFLGPDYRRDALLRFILLHRQT